MEPALVGIGGALGAISRYAIGQALRTRSFPWGTLVVNALGSFVLGAILVTGSSVEFLLLIGVGFCGAFTTFSSFGFETVSLWERGDRTGAIANAAGNLLLSLAGFVVAGWLFG